MNETIIEMRDISKAFAGVKALSKVRFELRRGEVHALMGENGAGKSTLMKILTGIYQKDEGQVLLAGENRELKEQEIRRPLDAQHLGISMVFQELNLLENMDIAENIFLGREPINPKTKTLDKKTLYENARRELARVKLDVDPHTAIADLSVGKKQTVEIAKCLSFNAKCIILDEPTASLTETESQVLFGLINELREKGVSIVYISHRMEEVFELADRITVFRDGHYIDTLETKTTNEQEIVKMMIGRDLEEEAPHQLVNLNAEIAMEVRNVRIFPKSKPVSFQLRKQEILGFFGLVGAGRTELARIIFGVDPIGDGEIRLKGEKVEIHRPKDAIHHGIGLVPEDRKGLGLILGMSIKDNMLLSKLAQFGPVLNKDKIGDVTGTYIKDLGIALASAEQEVKQLSGGNQQKVVLAKWLSMLPDVLILDEPTRGIDVGAKAEIYMLIRRLAEEGKSIIMISSEMAEILKVSDRVIVLHEGTKTMDREITGLDQEKIMVAAIGGTDNE